MACDRSACFHRKCLGCNLAVFQGESNVFGLELGVLVRHGHEVQQGDPRLDDFDCENIVAVDKCKIGAFLERTGDLRPCFEQVCAEPARMKEMTIRVDRSYVFSA